MAIVPMPDGPKVSPTVQQADNISLIAPKENQAENAALADYGKAASYLSKAVDNAYERFSKAKADAAFNDIQIATEDILRGQNGALLKQGSECISGDKPFVDDYMGQIKKVVADSAQGLDPYQKRILQRRVGNFMANRHAELTRHQIKEAQAFEVTVNKTKAEIAGRNIAIDPANIESVKRNRQDIAEAIIAMNPGAPKEALDKAIDDAVSKSLVTGIESFIANGDPGRAQALFAHYKGKGITAFDALSLQPKIRDALKKKEKEAQTDTAIAKLRLSLTPRGVASTTLVAGDGQPFSEQKFNKAAEQVTAVGKPEWVAQAYLLGEEKTQKILADWKKEGDEIVRRIQEAKPGSKERAEAKAEMSKFVDMNPFDSSLSPTQSAALNNYNSKTKLINSGDKDIIREQMLFADPDIELDVLAKAVNQEFVERQKGIRIGKMQASQQASEVFAQLTQGIRFKDIPDTRKDKLSRKQLDGLREYDRRKALNSFTTDTNLFCRYRYNIEALRALEWPDLYAMAGRFKEEDFNKLVAQKQSLERGNYKEDTKGIQAAVKDSLIRLGFSDTSPGSKPMYSRAFRVITEHITDRVNLDEGNGWDTERIRTEVAKYAALKFTRPTFMYWGTSKANVGELFTNKGALENAFGGDDSLKKILNAGLISTGYPEPNQLDRNELVLDFILDEDKVLPGEAAMVNAIPPSELRKIRQESPNADDHTIIRAALRARLVTRGKK